MEAYWVIVKRRWGREDDVDGSDTDKVENDEGEDDKRTTNKREISIA